MNGPGDIPLTQQHSSTPETGACNLISIIPTLGMSSCRGTAEAFARRLSSKLRTLGSQTDNETLSPEDEPIINGGSANTWVTTNNDSEHTVTNLQPLRHESDSFFDFDCELESPGSPVDECEYLRLVETASNTPHNSAPESGYACASAASSHSSTDGPYFDVSNTINPSSSSLDGRSSFIKQQQQQQPQQQQVQDTSKTSQNSTIINKNKLSPDSIQPNNECCKNCNCNGIISNHHSTTTTNENLQNSLHFIIESEENQSQDKNKNLDTNENAELKTNQINSELDLGPSECKIYKDGGPLTVQEQIIKELQRESQEISLADEKKSIKNEEINEILRETTTNYSNIKNIESPENVSLPISNNFGDNTTSKNISNGHSTESEKELLKVKVEDEISKEPKSNKLPQILAVNEETINESEQSLETNNNNNSSQEKSHLTTVVDITDDDEDDCRPQRVRRCSSLKTGKTPPGTPGRKKIVRFADVLGLDLADIKTFLDEIPTIPKSAFEDLEILDAETPIQLGPKSDKLLMPLFQQPGGLSTFLDLVREKQVSLENAAVTDHINQTIIGSVRVRNLDFHKSVHIRYTLDNWRSFADLQANYVENSCDGFSDKFTFTLFGNSLQIGQRLEFAVRFQCKGQQFWDNNYGTNYCFQCLPTASPAINPIQPIVPSHHNNNDHLTGLLSPTAGDAWCSSFY